MVNSSLVPVVPSELKCMHNTMIANYVASGGISEPCSNGSRITSGGKSHFMQVPFAAKCDV